MIQILKSSGHKQLIQIPKLNIIFGNNVVIVIAPNGLIQTVFGNDEKKQREKEFFLLLDGTACKVRLQNHLFDNSKHTRINSIQKINLLLTLLFFFRVTVVIPRVTQNQKIDILHIYPAVSDHLQFRDDVKLFFSLLFL